MLHRKLHLSVQAFAAVLLIMLLAAWAPLSIQGPAPADAGLADRSLSTFTTADFSGAGICAGCHADLKDISGADVSMPAAWRSTMMANAARDPVWQAKVSSEVARNGHLQSVIEGKCTACHMPMARTQAVTDGSPVAALGDGFFSTANPLHAAAIDGISCTLCHQMGDVSLGEYTSFSGGYVVDTSTVSPNRLVYGPYRSPFSNPMQRQSGYLPAFGQHVNASALCATCHNLYTPYVDAAGEVRGYFPEQTPYTEWEHSSFNAAGTSCQGCHMPLSHGGVVISKMPPALQPREPFYQHHFVGGNAFMVKILADWGDELGVTAEEVHFDATLDRVAQEIGQRSASLSLKRLALQDSTLVADLQVTSLAGHKFPTGFPSRRAWLHVTVTGAGGAVVFESGRPSASGMIAGNAADANSPERSGVQSGDAFEPHYDVITASDQVQIYEPIMGNTDDQPTYTLLRGSQFLKDNRLLPAGAVKEDLPADIAVYGEAANDVDFVGGADLITYEVNVAGAKGPFTFSAELLYESLSYRFVQDLLADGTPLTERFRGYYDQADKAPLVVAAITRSTASQWRILCPLLRRE